MREDKLIEWIEDWFKLAIPNPTIENGSVQIGCHIEEFAEMLTCLNPDGQACKEASELADKFKKRDILGMDATYIVADIDAYALQMLDALCAQIVTAIGIYHMMGWDIRVDLLAVTESNWSKFEEGKPVFDENGKIKKGRYYTPPKFKIQNQEDFDDLSNLDLFDGIVVEGGVCTDNDEGCEGGACKI